MKKKRSNIVRFGVSIPEELMKLFDDYIEKCQYGNRSEAIRDLIREKLVSQKWQENNEDTEVAATLTFVYDHHKRELSSALLRLQHDHQHIVIVSQHVHLDHHNCLEVIILKGKTKDILNLSNSIKALKGIKHCQLAMTTTGTDLV